MTRYIVLFDRVARGLRPLLNTHGLEASTGSWLGASVLKLQKPEWREEHGTTAARPEIFFSVWVDNKSLKKNCAFYNIHALQLRSLSAYSLQSREFAAAFRAAFSARQPAWPRVSTDHGPQTLMQGSIPLDDSFSEETAELVRRFVPLAGVIDTLLEKRRALGRAGTAARKARLQPRG